MTPQQGTLFDQPECMQLTPKDNRNAAYIDSKPNHATQALRVLQAIKELQPANYHVIHKHLERDGGIFPVTSLTRAIKDNADSGYIEVKNGDHKLYDVSPERHWAGKKIPCIAHYSLTPAGRDKLRSGK